MQEEKKTILACNYKEVPCPNQRCAGHTRYSIRNHATTREGEEREYDPFTYFASDSYCSLTSSELVATCDNPRCGVNRVNFSMPILHSVCPECKTSTLLVRTVCGFHNFRQDAIRDFLTGTSKEGVSVYGNEDLIKLMTPAIPTYDRKMRHQEQESEEIKFAVVSVCMKRLHVYFSFFSCPVKECLNPAIPIMESDGISYNCMHKKHASFRIAPESYPGVADLGSDACSPRRHDTKCPQCLTASPAVVNNMDGNVKPGNWMIPSYICSNYKCKFMWKME